MQLHQKHDLFQVLTIVEARQLVNLVTEQVVEENHVDLISTSTRRHTLLFHLFKICKEAWLHRQPHLEGVPEDVSVDILLGFVENYLQVSSQRLVPVNDASVTMNDVRKLMVGIRHAALVGIREKQVTKVLIRDLARLARVHQRINSVDELGLRLEGRPGFRLPNDLKYLFEASLSSDTIVSTVLFLE